MAWVEESRSWATHAGLIDSLFVQVCFEPEAEVVGPVLLGQKQFVRAFHGPKNGLGPIKIKIKYNTTDKYEIKTRHKYDMT